MINYIKNIDLGGIDYPLKKYKTRSALGLIKNLCEENLFTLEGYLKAIKKVLDIKYKAPIFINDKMIFLYTKSIKLYENIFVNFMEIMNVESFNNKIVVYFKNNDKIELDLTINQYKRLVRTIFSIFEYKKSLV